MRHFTESKYFLTISMLSPYLILPFISRSCFSTSVNCTFCCSLKKRRVCDILSSLYDVVHRQFRMKYMALYRSVHPCLTVSRNGRLLWVKFDFTSSNKSLLLFVALRKLCRDSTKMNFKSSQNCRRVKLAALGERGWESCS